MKGANIENKIIRICFLSPSSYHFFTKKKEKLYGGGAQFQMYMLAKEISKNISFEVVFFNKNEQQPKIEYFEKIKSVKTFSLFQKDHFLTKIIKAIKLFFFLIKYNPDVTVSTTANSSLFIIYLFTKYFNKKYIFRTAHLFDIDNTWIKNNGFLGKLYKYALLNTSVIITQFKEHQNIIYKNYNKPSIIIKNAFDITNTSFPDKNGILWVSRFKKWKNPDLFLKLVEKFPEQQFTMICPYREDDLYSWKNFRNRALKIKNLIFIEKVEFYEIQEYFNKAKIFINTSYAEGFPNSFLQAAQGRTPIISLNVNPDNFLNKYNCGIFCNNDFNFLIEQTEYLLNNKKELNIKGENCFKYIKDNHDINEIGKQFEQIIYNLYNIVK